MGNMLSRPLLSVKKSAAVVRRVVWGEGRGVNRKRQR